MCCLGVSFVIGGPDEAVLVSGVGYDRPKILHQVKGKILKLRQNWKLACGNVPNSCECSRSNFSSNSNSRDSRNNNLCSVSAMMLSQA